MSRPSRVRSPRFVVGDELDDVVALRRRVFRVGADVEIEPGAVLEENVAASRPPGDTTRRNR